MNERLKKEAEKLFDHICIMVDCTNQRVIGYYEDENDSYYVVKSLKGKITHHSMVGTIISLKDQLNEKDYQYLDYRFKVNDLSSN